MIQRIQSLYLLGASICAFLSFKFPFYSGQKKINAEQKYLTASANFGILLLTIALAVGILAIIFLYKNRKEQMKYTLIALLISIVSLVVYFFAKNNFVSGTYSFGAILPIAIPVLLSLAVWNIRKDEKLVKSLDRLR
jgi:peptidoglycan/LPS O-acetylase OafA/YrhL